MPTKNIFICYRRDDAAGYARSIFDRVNARFPNRVFMDVTGITPGSDYSQVIQDTVGTCNALLALIGKSWVTTADGSNRRRLDLPDDYVRHEIATALQRNIPVIPVLLRGAQMPAATMLPPDLAALSLREAVEITDTDFDHDVHRLITALERQFGEYPVPASPPATTGGRSNCLIFGLIGSLIVGAIVVVLFVLGLLAASTNQNSVQSTNPVSSQPATSNPAPSQAQTSEPSTGQSAGTENAFHPVGRWIVTFQQNGVPVQSELVLYGNNTFQSANESGTWEYDPDERRLTLSGWLLITIEDQVGNEFVGHGQVGYATFPIRMRPN